MIHNLCISILLVIIFSCVAPLASAKSDKVVKCNGHERFAPDEPKSVLYYVNYKNWDSHQQKYTYEYVEFQDGDKISLKTLRQVASDYQCAELTELKELPSEDSFYETFFRFYDGCFSDSAYELTGFCRQIM